MNRFLRLIKHLSISLGLSIGFLLFTAGACDDSTGSLPLITTKFPEKTDIELGPVFLRYDLSKFVENCQKYGKIYPASDLQELSDYNNVSVASSWLNFNTLFNKADMYSGPGAEAKFIFSQPECSGSITVLYRKFDDMLCNHNIISNAPYINKIHLIEFSAHTIKSSQNNVFIKWNRSFTATGQGAYVNIDATGTVDYPNYLMASKTRGDNQVAARVENGQYVVIENTITQELDPGFYTPVVVEDPPFVSDVLGQCVYVSGCIDKTIKWDIPLIIKLEKK